MRGVNTGTVSVGGILGILVVQKLYSLIYSQGPY